MSIEEALDRTIYSVTGAYPQYHVAVRNDSDAAWMDFSALCDRVASNGISGYEIETETNQRSGRVVRINLHAVSNT
jgi:hypothetical protein